MRISLKKEKTTKYCYYLFVFKWTLIKKTFTSKALNTLYPLQIILCNLSYDVLYDVHTRGGQTKKFQSLSSGIG